MRQSLGGKAVSSLGELLGLYRLHFRYFETFISILFVMGFFFYFLTFLTYLFPFIAHTEGKFILRDTLQDNSRNGEQRYMICLCIYVYRSVYIHF